MILINYLQCKKDIVNKELQDKITEKFIVIKTDSNRLLTKVGKTIKSIFNSPIILGLIPNSIIILVKKASKILHSFDSFKEKDFITSLLVMLILFIQSNVGLLISCVLGLVFIILRVFYMNKIINNIVGKFKTVANQKFNHILRSILLGTYIFFYTMVASFLIKVLSMITVVTVIMFVSLFIVRRIYRRISLYEPQKTKSIIC